MAQLTIRQHDVLQNIKSGKEHGTVSKTVKILLEKGLIKETESGIVEIVKGKSYNYRGNTYTL